MRDNESKFPNKMSYNGNGENGKYGNAYGYGYSGTPTAGFADIFWVLYRGKWIILSACLLALGAAVWHTDNTEPMYESSSKIMIESQRPHSDAGFFDVSPVRGDRDGIGPEVEILKNSVELAERVAVRLIEENMNEQTADTLPILKRVLQRHNEVTPAALARILPGYIDVRRVDNLNMLEVKARSTDPEEAAYIVNLYVNEYQIYDQDISRSKFTGAGAYLRQLEEEKGRALREQEERIRSFMEQDNFLVMEHGGARTAEEIDRLTSEVEFAEMELQLLAHRIDLLREEKEEVKTMLETRRASGTIQRFEALQTALADYEIQAEQFYVERPELRENPQLSPELEAILEQTSKLRERLSDISRVYSDETLHGQTLDHATLGNHLFELRREIRRNENEKRELEENIAFKRSQVERSESRIPQVLSHMNQLEEMRRDKRIQEQLYTAIQENVQQNRIAEQAELSRVRLVSPAFVPGSPSSPNKTQNYIVGLLFGLLAGMGLVFLRKSMDSKVRDPEELRKKGYSVLGVIPDMAKHVRINSKGKARTGYNGRMIDSRLVTLIKPLSGISESYRRLRVNIDFSLGNKKVKTLTISSSKPGEGKSLNSMNLALSMAHSGKKVLMVDADLRKPTAHSIIGSQREPGLSDLLLRNINFKMEFFETGIENFYFLPCGRSVSNPAELLASGQMEKFLKSAAGFFDLVIFDTPPLQVVTDASVLAVKSDATILVARANDTEFRLIDQTRQDLEKIGVEVSGVILNRFVYQQGNSYSNLYKYTYKNAYKELYSENKAN